MIKAIFHIHTEYSNHGNILIDDLEKVCIDNKIDVVFITEHNTIQPAKEAQKLFKKTKIVIGEEIRTSEGEIIGIFLKNEILSGLAPEETISLIRAQGGIAVVPHPYDILRFETIQPRALNRILHSIDIIEIFNSRNIFQNANKRADNLANEYNKYKIVGSDAHTRSELTNSLIFMEDFTSSKEFMNCLPKAKFVCRKSGLWPHVVSKYIKFFK